MPILAGAYLDGAPPGHTGGFGEPTCRACHVGPEEARAEVLLRGVPRAYQPGRTYPIVVEVTRPGLGRGGFQLAVRFAAGSAAGRQAGSLEPAGPGAAVVSGEEGVQYAGHAVDGTRPVAPDTARWSLRWTAPCGSTGTVVFHAAGNAANDDDSPFGDAIGVARTESAVVGAR